MPRLTEQEQQEIIRFIEADKPLPDKYRFLLFEDKREVELVWNGKTQRGLQYRPALPGHRAGGRAAGGKARRQAEGQIGVVQSGRRGRQLKGWTNKLIWGDNKLILSSA